MSSENGNRVVDLDVLKREAGRQPIQIRFKGEIIEAPAELPFRAARALSKVTGLDPSDAASAGPLFDALEQVMVTLIGPDKWAEIVETPGFSQDDANRLLQGVFVNYGLADAGGKPEEALGESPASSP